MNPTKLGPYEIQGVLGRGGMGTVYRARHFDTSDVVALKALSINYIEDTHFRQRFESEIKALLKLDHPNIVRLISYGQDQGILFFAMELVEGKSLFHLQREVKVFDWRDVLVIAKDVTMGLRHAHDRGIIHRDLKPGNLLKSKQGLIKVTDFGIAKSFGTSHDTRDNVVGTIDFMSPEQALGRPVTVRSDLYSLGVVLYTLLTGAPPFNSNSIEQSLRNLTTVPAPKVRQAVPNVPDPIEDLISELLEKRPEARTPTALALLRKLEQIEGELRDYSEAQTAQIQLPDNLSRQETFRLGEPLDMLNRKTGDVDPTQRSAGEKTGGGKRSQAATNAAQETAILGEKIELEPEVEKPKRQVDYFSTVTDQQRRQHAAPEPKPAKSSSGLALVLAGFVLTIGLAIGGAYLALKPPTADQLFSQIELNASRPETIRETLRRFLELYPNDPRIGHVEQLKLIADSISLYKRLAVRRNLPGSEMSQSEKQFVDVIATTLESPAEGFPKLDAFVALHDAGPNTPVDLAELVNAARAFQVKLRFDAKNKVSWDRQKIVDALERAGAAEDGGLAIYKSIVALYDGVEWAREYVDRAKQGLQNLN